MSCCGRSRLKFKPATPAVKARAIGTVAFEYTGNSRLTVIGPVSRIRYDFVGRGARMQVDRRDSNSLATVPTLRRV